MKHKRGKRAQKNKNKSQGKAEAMENNVVIHQTQDPQTWWIQDHQVNSFGRVGVLPEWRCYCEVQAEGGSSEDPAVEGESMQGVKVFYPKDGNWVIRVGSLKNFTSLQRVPVQVFWITTHGKVVVFVDYDHGSVALFEEVTGTLTTTFGISDFHERIYLFCSHTSGESRVQRLRQKWYEGLQQASRSTDKLIFHIFKGKLKKIRVTFVKGANRDVINQLLDGLFDDGILNGGEKDSILEGNPITADRARALIDAVMKKGDEASNKMIALLLSIDPTLYAALGLPSENPAQPAAAPEPQLGQDGSGTLINSTEDFWKGKQGQRNTYPAAKESMRHRMALLITNIKFTTLLDRAGADRDEKNMYKLLVALGYEVVIRTNLTGKEIDATVIEFSKHKKLKETDSVVVVIMSHGKLGAVFGVDWKGDTPKNEELDEFSIDNIYLHLGPKGCRALLDKPKIILIQACRGDKKGSELVKDGLSSDDASHYAGHEDFEEDGLRFVNSEKDFFALLSCTPDTVSYRHPLLGSLLIQYFVAVVNASAHVDHIDELSRKVQQRFEDSKITIQMPTKDRVTLTKDFYFFPGI
ncbi:hypothetical protein KUCAC02_011420 [Chaenocephalus aceratus]|uniref:Uncharacterized protein n=1 Tax=Chaenocephalus aceratus TaxID=36190 RepID=A0ACB9WVW1_CHAAC|nr:hypothetical protein KUCAC02_011420 [Chaenocephalus aceratus]